MPIIRKQLKPSDVYPADIRYDGESDKIQSLVNGSWVDNPAVDPRTQTTFPPRMTSDPQCDAAQSVSDALHNQITEILTAISGAQTAFTIAGIILSLFTFGIFGVFITLALFLAHLMLDAGTSTIEASLTTGAWDTFTCILFCHMTNEGRLNPGEMDAVKTDVDTKIGGVGATIIDAMLTLAGEGGVNNLASLGSATGDCSGCDCVGDTCFEKWAVPVGITTYGKISDDQTGLSEGEIRFETLDINTNNLYYVIVITDGDNSGCLLKGAVADPSVTLTAYSGYGANRTDYGNYTIGSPNADSQCVNGLLFNSAAPFSIVLTFAECS
jgi:hypothetical protein